MAKALGTQPLITDDHLEVEETIEKLAPELILGTQMERHIGKRLGIPCAVISAPVHVQDFPARYAPQMGYEGANVLFDTIIHPLVMGLEEHLLTMFRDDFEFHDDAGPSHHHGAHHVVKKSTDDAQNSNLHQSIESSGMMSMSGEMKNISDIVWLKDAEKELKKIPFFVRGKAKRNTEAFARDRGVFEITIDTLYEAKAHYAR
jgi:light-independent protochlorophyllide reductase subunit B